MPFLAPIFASIGAWVTTTLAAGGIGAMLLRFGASLILSAVARSLMPRHQAGGGGTQVSVRQAAMPRDMVYGKVKKGGTIVFVHTTGGKNEYLHLIVAFATHKIEAIDEIYFGNELAVDSGGTIQSKFSAKMTFDKRLGASSQAAFSGLITDAPDKWTSQHNLNGIACLYLRLRFDQDAFPGGIPNVTAVIRGKNDIFDPRSNTSGYTNNAALCIADYLSNVRFGFGLQMASGGELDKDAVIAAANICDENVTLADSSTEKRYACDGVITLETDPMTAARAMLSSMAGSLAQQGGNFFLLAGAYQTSTMTIDEDDVRDAGFSLSTRVAASQNANGVRGRFVSPQNDWQEDDFPPYQSSVYLAEDSNIERWIELDLPFTKSAKTAQRLAKIKLELIRRQMTLKVAGKLSLWNAAVGTVADVTYARWGFSSKPFVVNSCNLSVTGSQDGVLALPDLTLQETSPLVYDWSASEERIYAAAPRTTLPSAFDVGAPGNPIVSEELYQARPGAQKKVRVNLSWVASNNSDILYYVVQGSNDGGATYRIIDRTENLYTDRDDTKTGAWKFRVKAVTALGVSSPWALTNYTVIGNGSPPAALSGLSVQQAGGMAVIKWNQSADEDVVNGGRINIRHCADSSPSFAKSIYMDYVPGNSAVAVVPLLAGTYYLRPVDASGNRGAVSSIDSPGTTVIAYTVLGSVVEQPTFASTGKTNVSLDGSTLILTTTTDVNGNTVAANTSGSYRSFAIDLTTSKKVRLRHKLVMDTRAFNDLIDARTANIDTWDDFDGAGDETVNVEVQFRWSNDSPSVANANGTWSGWARLDANEFEARSFQFKINLTTVDVNFSPAITTFEAYADGI